jgi:hypothetical protein
MTDAKRPMMRQRGKQFEVYFPASSRSSIRVIARAKRLPKHNAEIQKSARAGAAAAWVWGISSRGTVSQSIDTTANGATEVACPEVPDSGCSGWREAP